MATSNNKIDNGHVVVELVNGRRDKQDTVFGRKTVLANSLLKELSDKYGDGKVYANDIEDYIRGAVSKQKMLAVSKFIILSMFIIIIAQTCATFGVVVWGNNATRQLYAQDDSTGTTLTNTNGDLIDASGINKVTDYSLLEISKMLDQGVRIKNIDGTAYITSGANIDRAYEFSYDVAGYTRDIGGSSWDIKTPLTNVVMTASPTEFTITDGSTIAKVTASDLAGRRRLNIMAVNTIAIVGVYTAVATFPCDHTTEFLVRRTGTRDSTYHSLPDSPNLTTNGPNASGRRSKRAGRNYWQNSSYRRFLGAVKRGLISSDTLLECVDKDSYWMDPDKNFTPYNENNKGTCLPYGTSSDTLAVRLAKTCATDSTSPCCNVTVGQKQCCQAGGGDYAHTETAPGPGCTGSCRWVPKVFKVEV